MESQRGKKGGGEKVITAVRFLLVQWGPDMDLGHAHGKAAQIPSELFHQPSQLSLRGSPSSDTKCHRTLEL